MENLRIMRNAARKTQNDVAVILGVNRTTYTKYETGEREPDFETIKKLAEYFGTTSSYLIGETDDPTPPGVKKTEDDIQLDDIEFALFGEVHELSEEEKEELLRNARRMNAVRKMQQAEAEKSK